MNPGAGQQRLTGGRDRALLAACSHPATAAAWHSCSNYASESVRQVHDVFMPLLVQQRGLIGQREVATVDVGQREDVDTNECTAPRLPSKSTLPMLNACYARLSRSHVLSALIVHCSSPNALSS